MKGEFPAERQAVIPSPVGPLRLRAAGNSLVGIDFIEDLAEFPTIPDDPLLREAAKQLGRYFEDPSAPFTLPLYPDGTPYLNRIWAALREIPAGRAETYGAVAARAGGSARSVGLACRKNPLPIVIPCHRVLGARGLVGYCGFRSGPGLSIKRWLLNHEGCRID